MDTQGIGLIEVLWKDFEAVINTRVKLAVHFHDVLHVFFTLKGKGTSAMELIMSQEMAIID